jgi:nucleotidyltransferase/DNA polymerase involved in DNA repair
MAHGIDRSEVEPRSEVKSISHETTFEEDTADISTVLEALDMLSEDVSKEALDQSLFYKTITIKIRYENFETHTRSRTLPFLTCRLYDLEKAAKEMLLANLQVDRKVRLVGIRASSLVSSEKQMTLF